MSTRRLTIHRRSSGPSPYARIDSVRGPVSAFTWMRGLLGRYLSVRLKLTLWYGFMCAATLTLSGIAMKTYLDAQFSRDIDTSLRAAGVEAQVEIQRAEQGGIAQAIGQAGCRPKDLSNDTNPVLHQFCLQIRNGLYQATAHLTASGQFVVVELNVNPGIGGGPVRITQPGVPPRAIPNPGIEVVGRVMGEQRSIFATQNYRPEGSHEVDSLRLYYTPLVVPQKVGNQGYGGAIVVMQNTKTYDEIGSRFNRTFLVIIPLGVLIALIAGWWIARTALRPINRISRTVRAIGVSKDLTRRVNFVGPHDEVGQLAATFDGMMDRLESAFEAQKRFIADASHELRTPLTAIRGNADLMRIAPPDEREVCLIAIRRESERMTRLVTDLLLLAEADVDEHPLQLRPLDLDELVMDVHRSAQLVAGGKVEVVLEAVEPVQVNGDSDRLKQLFLNLMDNAIKFTPEGGTVSIGLHRDGSEARVDVADSGIGIPKEEQDAIFERFYRVETSRSKRGSGLGLAISAWVVQGHGGRIEVQSEPGKGSTFSVWLPVLSDQSDESNQKVSRQSPRLV